MKLPTAALMLPLLLSPLAQATDRTVIDLNQPGAIEVEALQQDNPQHYRKVVDILDKVQRLPAQSVPGWMKMAHAAEQIDYRDLLLVSNPPQRRLSFRLDDTRYAAVVVLPLQARAMPAH